MLIKAMLIDIVVFACMPPAGQEITIGGNSKIRDPGTSSPVDGVSVLVKGTALGTQTDSTGNFSLSISKPLPFKLLVSYVGFIPAEIDVTEESKKLIWNFRSQMLLVKLWFMLLQK